MQNFELSSIHELPFKTEFLISGLKDTKMCFIQFLQMDTKTLGIEMDFNVYKCVLLKIRNHFNPISFTKTSVSDILKLFIITLWSKIKKLFLFLQQAVDLSASDSDDEINYLSSNDLRSSLRKEKKNCNKLRKEINELRKNLCEGNNLLL